ncbi:MAG: LamG domain-containing protein [Phycisphaerae bacterium]|jgi:hypothetical protein
MIRGIAFLLVLICAAVVLQTPGVANGPERGRGDGDYDGNGLIEYPDWSALAACLGGPGNEVTTECLPGDFDGDTDLDLHDVAAFMVVFGVNFEDCNGNGIPDELDIASGYSDDCNADLIPDECQLSGVIGPCSFTTTVVENTTTCADEIVAGPPDDSYCGLENNCVTLYFDCGLIVDGEGPDLTVYEVDWGAMEFSLVDVLVSADGETFLSVKASESTAVAVPGDEAHDNPDFARSYDLAVVGLSEVQYVRVQGQNVESGNGFDLDAVGAVNTAGIVFDHDCNDNGALDECDIAGGAFYAHLAHRYSFAVGAEDGIGGADGTIFGEPVIEDGVMTFDGVDDYVELPIADTIATLTNMTIEVWVEWNFTGGEWQRAFDIGTEMGNCMFLTPSTGGHPRFAIRTPSVQEQIVDGAELFPTGMTHVAVVIDAAGQHGYLYVNGEPAGENPAVTLTPADLGAATIGYLGKSFWPDPLLNGQMDEFRIYTAALSAADVAASYAAGPDWVAPPVSMDCNANGVPDECELAAGTSHDCQPNGILDECDIAAGTSLDLNGNGVPDECDAWDCNGNGIPDEEDIASGYSQDCNGNERPDECDIADGISQDCQPNGIPDECDVAAGDLHPSILHRWSFDGDATDSVGGADGTLNGGAAIVEGALTLDGADDYVDLPISSTMNSMRSFTVEAWLILHGGVNSPRLFECGTDTGQYMYLTPKKGGWPVPPQYGITLGGSVNDIVVAENSLFQDALAHLAVTYDDATHTGQIYIDGLPDGPAASIMIAPDDLTSGGLACFLGKSIADTHYLYATVREFRIYGAALSPEEMAASYTLGENAAGGGGSADGNGNGIPDECEMNDCNHNGIPDDEDIASGYSLDCNENGVPDECDIADGTSDDCNDDGIPDECPCGPPEGFALYLDGVSQYADLGTEPALADLPVGDFTVEMWIRTLDTSRSVLIGNYDGNPSWNIELHDTFPAGHLRVYLDGEDHHDDVSLADGAWHHVAVVRQLPVEGTGAVTMYIDGVESYSGVSNHGPYTVARSTMLGRDPRAGSHYFAGLVDDVRVWALARGREEIRQDMYSALDGTQMGLVAYWQCDEGMGGTIMDLVGQSDGTLFNGPVWWPVWYDCNENGVLDECDIADGTSQDLNGNGIPDECE